MHIQYLFLYFNMFTSSENKHYENSDVHGGNSINQSCPRILKSLGEEKTRDYEKSPNLDALSEQEPSKLAEQVCQAQAR